MTWRTSSHSAACGNCVQVAWRKSSRSESGNCVEVASHGVILVRDSKNPYAGHLTMTPAQWRAFLERVKDDHAGQV